jgi:ubiquinone biosynthesis monooxygenase Coq6
MLRTIQSKHLVRPFIKYAINKNRHLATVAQDLENAYDVVIIGGGIAGVTLACSLGNIILVN